MTNLVPNHPADHASIRDPRGKVHVLPDRALRSLSPRAYRDYLTVRPILTALESSGRILPSRVIDAPEYGPHVIEHPLLDFVSYPYEWCFSALRKAALAHLDLQITLFGHGLVLDDASAFNIQFRGAEPVFIDIASIRPYVPGEYWGGYRQFCEQFLYPLLLSSYCGVMFQPWFRGRLSGLDGRDLSRLLPLRSMLSPQALIHVHLHAALESRLASDPARAASHAPRRPLARASYEGMLRGLHRWITRLSLPRGQKTVWAEYERENSYGSAEAEGKRRFVARFVAERRPGLVVDLGCNTGHYSEVALSAGARSVVGIDKDLSAVERAFARSSSRSLAFLPLLGDLSNLSPDQGWAGCERASMARRLRADALIALAVVHHLTFGASIALPGVVAWITSLAPEGVVEFIPPDDPMVRVLTAHRDTEHLDYSRESFLRALAAHADVTGNERISASGRELFCYQSKAPRRAS